MPPCNKSQEKIKIKISLFPTSKNNKITNKTNLKGLILIKMMEECKIKSNFIII